MVGWFYGMLLLSSKCPRPLGRRWNSVWKTIWKTILKDQYFFLEQWLNIICFQREIYQDFINLAFESLLCMFAWFSCFRKQNGRRIWTNDLEGWLVDWQIRWSRLLPVHLWPLTLYVQARTNKQPDEIAERRLERPVGCGTFGIHERNNNNWINTAKDWKNGLDLKENTQWIV